MGVDEAEAGRRAGPSSDASMTARRVLAAAALAGLALWGLLGAFDVAVLLARAAVQGWFGPVAMAVARGAGL